MVQKYKIPVVVFLILTRINDKEEQEILLQKRKNTGYMDENVWFSDLWSFRGKWIAVMQAKEELGLDIKSEDLELVNVYHENKSDFGNSYISFFFKVLNYDGVPIIIETNRCEELLWVKG